METTISKSANFGWFAQTYVQVTSTMRVAVITVKRADGLITTIAREERVGPAGMYFYAPYSMWSVRVKISEGRATKQAIERQQAEALFEIDDIIKQAKLPEAA
jgi:hypothetical protein